MAQQSYAFFAVLVALAFAIMSLAACANSKQDVGPQAESIAIGATGDPGAEEFHGAPIGADTLRGALPSEN
jgi:hypothetical protein